MTDPWEAPPADLDDRVKAYIGRANKVDLKPELVEKYARILVAAEEVVAHRVHYEQTIPEEVASVAAGEHGIYTDDPVKAREAYASARKSEQKVHASASACSKKLAKLEMLLEEHYRFLKVDVVDQFPLRTIKAAAQLVRDFASATKPGQNFAQFKMAKSELSLTVPSQTLLWWRIYVPQYKGKWTDVYGLALCWHLTDAKDLQTFQRRVKKLNPRPDSEEVTSILGCPPWARP